MSYRIPILWLAGVFLFLPSSAFQRAGVSTAEGGKVHIPCSDGVLGLYVAHIIAYLKHVCRAVRCRRSMVWPVHNHNIVHCIAYISERVVRCSATRLLDSEQPNEHLNTIHGEHSEEIQRHKTFVYST